MRDCLRICDLVRHRALLTGPCPGCCCSGRNSYRAAERWAAPCTTYAFRPAVRWLTSLLGAGAMVQRSGLGQVSDEAASRLGATPPGTRSEGNACASPTPTHPSSMQDRSRCPPIESWGNDRGPPRTCRHLPARQILPGNHECHESTPNRSEPQRYRMDHVPGGRIGAADARDPGGWKTLEDVFAGQGPLQAPSRWASPTRD
jgi:hypothetical protein